MATFNYDINGACEAMIAQAKDYAGRNYPGPGGLGRSVGALDFITSPTNGSIKTELNTGSQGKKLKRARVFYKQRTKPCEILTGSTAKASALCDTPVEAEEKEVTVEITGRVATTPRAFSNTKMVTICQDTKQFVDEFLMSDMRALRETVSEQVLALMAADAGVIIHQDGTTDTPAGSYKSKKLLATDANGQKIPLTGNYNDILMDYQNMQFQGLPALIGQGNLQTYFQLAGLACCNSATPYGDALSRAGAAFFLDQAANNILGDAGNRFLMAAFGISHLLWFNENANIDINTDVYKHIVIQDPVYPALKWDVDFKWDPCNTLGKVWLYQISAYYDVFNLIQADSFANYTSPDPSPTCVDELYGVTGIWGYKATAA